MENAGTVAGKVRGFVADVVTEIRKTSWPTRQELVESTWVVIAMVLALGLYIAFCDWFLIKLLGWLVPRG
jgi:preprotein translocase subunit SecE